MERPEWEKHGGGMGEKVCLITGATSGIGKATAMGLANMGAGVVMVGRDRDRGEAALAEIKEKSTNASVDLMLADLSSQEEIRRLAGGFKDAHPRLEVLINDAGLFRNKRITTADGLEMTFAVNHLAYFLLTNLLLDVLKAAPRPGSSTSVRATTPTGPSTSMTSGERRVTRGRKPTANRSWQTSSSPTRERRPPYIWRPPQRWRA
jgi:NAD(P)-dependent dehydrogenase (short-subunit alcohol dehydrogenase family)